MNFLKPKINFVKPKMNFVKPKMNFKHQLKQTYNLGDYNYLPKCENCKYSDNINGEDVCKLFRAVTVKNDRCTYNYYISTFFARYNNDLCGEDGKYFKEK
jgi:hypothetical protein